MNLRRTSEGFLPATWPLAASAVLTGVVVALVCEPPASPLRTWGQLLLLALLYVAVAACVHALAVWGVCRIQRAEGAGQWPGVWQVIWGAWIAVVWLPLLALLTSEKSTWVVFILPVTAIFATLFFNWRRPEMEDERLSAVGDVTARLFWQEERAPLWRTLLPAVLASVALEGGVAAYAAGHAWIAGALFGAAAAYVAERLLSRSAMRNRRMGERSTRRASAGNSIAVWVLMVMALLPFLAGMGAAMAGLMGMPAVHAARRGPAAASGHGTGWMSIILTLPRKPHEIVTPLVTSQVAGMARSRMIPFDGTYWYYKNVPTPNAHVVQGDPIRNHIKSTDMLPISMEAHQPLGAKMALSCCSSLQLNVVNADAVPGRITLEVLLRDKSGKTVTSTSLGSRLLASSAVTPMPLHRAPVHETLRFQIPRGAKTKSFDEITVRIVPERSRSLAGPSVSVESFMLQP